ncbi:hypothetical protein ACF0H5_014484 [Mactra antiquata]
MDMMKANMTESVETVLDQINDLDDIMDVFDYAEANDIVIDGLDTVDEMKERFILHYWKNIGMKRKEEIEKTILLAGQDDSNRRTKLVSVMRQMMSIILKQDGNESPSKQQDSNRPILRRRNSQFMEGLLRTEGTSLDLAADCEDRINDLEHGECLVLVAGETSAGKSSVLNLIFEDDILPVHNNSSTSTITIIRYGKRKHARVVYKNDQPDEEFDLDTEGVQKLHTIAFMKTASEREFHNVKEVQVYLPLPILQSGLVLVDTPGIGENEFLESELKNFIEKNTILGFMYIIKTDNAGGVQEDRLLGLLKIVLDMHNTGQKRNSLHFDPKSALFVCNRVDLVGKNEVERVKRNAIDKLQECWPCLDESQVVFFSTQKAQRDIKVDTHYVSDNYKQFLEGLRSLYITSVERRIKQSYKWIENILKRIIHHLKSVIKRLDLSDKDLKTDSENTRSKLENLRQRSDSVLGDLKTKLRIEYGVINQELKEHLQSNYCKEKITRNWKHDCVPNVENGLGNYRWLRSRIHEAFFDKVVECVEDWDKEEKRIITIEQRLACDIKFGLQLLEDELKEVEREIQGDSSSLSSDDMSDLSKSKRRSFPRYSPNKALSVLAERPKMPLKIAGRVIKPIMNVINPVISKMKVKEYSKNPVQFAEKLACQMYTELLDNSQQSEETLMNLAEYLFERPSQYIAAIENKIPDMILSNQLMLNNLETSIEEERKHHQEYEEMMTMTEALKRSLMEYGQGYIFVADFSRGELQIEHSVEGNSVSVAFNVTDFLRGSSGDLDLSQRRDVRALWTVTYAGCLNRNGVNRPVAIRVYLPSSGVEFTYNEVAKLRCLTWQNTCVAEFLGIHNAETRTPAFVYDGELRSVRRYFHTFCSKRDIVPEIITETALGLEYLHVKGLVHMELNQDTVTVNEQGSVQLSGACLPRNAKLPFDTETTETGNFVYLAPEVLRGEKYEPFADIYSFGLFVLELAHVDVPVTFIDQRKMTLCDFIRDVNPETMLKLEETVEIFTNKTRALIFNCLDLDKLCRPLMSEVVEYASYIRLETDALSRLPTRKTRGRIRRGSSGVKSTLNIS